ncbi:rna-dependent dna polymerase [Lasius niger]|uniref:Rna-dependent dna polymerase n=1 Tax=Lasius niger TaxID=67767 RepID=A0A0J7K814_LASNI|nr:rna-dependent dna polymerase [Lasius niger]
MAGINSVRIEPLNKDNFDTWKIQMQALLVKTEGWQYVSGQNVKPALVANNIVSAAAVKAWELNDEKAKSDIILSISPPELKQVKGHNTSKEVWDRLHAIYQSRGPARTATLLKNLMLRRMEEGEDVREHLRNFFDTVDKLAEMDIDINKDLLSVMLLYSLPKSFENFRCAIESRDELPTAEILRVKITEEYDARKGDSSERSASALMIKRSANKKKPSKSGDNKKTFKYRCHRCQKVGHKANECQSKVNQSEKESAKKADTVSLCAVVKSANVREKAANCRTDGVTANLGTENTNWCLDSGCTAHLCNDLSKFVDDIDETVRQQLNLANSASTHIVGKGTASIFTETEGQTKDVSVADTLYVPDLRMNLLSVGKITDRGYTVIFTNKKADIVDNRNGDVAITARRANGLYCVIGSSREGSTTAITSSAIASTEDYIVMWHRRMGHLNFRDLIKCDKNGSVRGMNLKDTTARPNCDVCTHGKMTRPPFSRRLERSTSPLQIVHTDLCGPMRTSSNAKALYFITFIDDYSRWCEIHFLKTKDEALEAFKKYKSYAKRKTGARILSLQSDNGGEYINKAFDAYMEQLGIKRRLTTPRTSEQNGVAERRNRTTVEMARCMLLGSRLSASFWAEAVNAANYVRNRCPSSTLNGKTPYELWIKRPPNVDYFREFGCDVYVLDKKPGIAKFEPRSKIGTFIGYSNENKGFRVWIPEEKKVVVTRDIKFAESRESPDRGEVSQDRSGDLFSYSEIDSKKSSTPISTGIDVNGNASRKEPEAVTWKFNSSDKSNEIVEDDIEDVTEYPIEDDFEDATECPIEDNFDDAAEYPIEEDIEDVAEADRAPENDDGSTESNRRGPGRPKLIRTGRRGRPAKQYHTANSASYQEDYVFQTEVSTKSALHGPDSDDWYRAMSEEVKSILNKETWSIVNRPRNRSIVGSRFFLRNKYAEDGKIERRKARIVAKGYSQRPGLDFHATFAPVARMGSIRMIIALAAQLDMEIHHIDVTTAYLNGVLQEEIYMELPPHLTSVLERLAQQEGDSITRTKAAHMLDQIQKGDTVCRLHKALYGLRQAGRCWHTNLDAVLKTYGAKNASSDPCIYYKGQGEDIILIATYVDDIVIAARDPKKIAKLKHFLNAKFELKDSKEIKRCLGIEFLRSKNEIRLKQSALIREILHRFDMID